MSSNSSPSQLDPFHWFESIISKNKISQQIWIFTKKYFPFVLVIFLVIYALYYIFSFYYELKRRYHCISLKNLFNGKIFKCFEDPPEYCKNIDSDLYWGWCLDNDLYGSYPGDKTGPYGLTCNQWIYNPHKCPPLQCHGNYPLGLHINDKNGQIQEYGWCADPQINKPVKGTQCGPAPEENITCQNWIWDESKCPKTCPQTISNINKSIPQPKNISQQKNPQNCSTICGKVNGQNIPCPPPDCLDKKCQC